MISYNEEIKELPKDVQFPMMKVLDKLRGELMDTVTKTDFKRLENVVSALADKILELAEAQKRTEQRVEELAEAQKKTEETLRQVVNYRYPKGIAASSEA